MPIDPDLLDGLTPGAKIIIILIIVGIPVLGTVMVAGLTILASKIDRVDKKADSISTQNVVLDTKANTTVEHVANDHGTNLRDDLDKVERKVDRVDGKVDRLIELNAQQLLSMQNADVTHEDRVNAVVERVNDLSTRIRRVEHRKELRDD